MVAQVQRILAQVVTAELHRLIRLVAQAVKVLSSSDSQ
jgi:hypothetical protein